MTVENKKKGIGALHNGSKQQRMKKQKTTGVVDEITDCPCLYCCELFSLTGGKWIRCTVCMQWAHIECAGVSYQERNFVCENRGS